MSYELSPDRDWRPTTDSERFTQEVADTLDRVLLDCGGRVEAAEWLYCNEAGGVLREAYTLCLQGMTPAERRVHERWRSEGIARQAIENEHTRVAALRMKARAQLAGGPVSECGKARTAIRFRTAAVIAALNLDPGDVLKGAA